MTIQKQNGGRHRSFKDPMELTVSEELNYKGRTIPDHVKEFHDACQHGYVRTVNRLLYIYGIQLLHEPDIFGDCAYEIAFKFRQQKVLDCFRNHMQMYR